MHDVPDRPLPAEDAAGRQPAPDRGPQPVKPSLEDFANDFLAEEPQPVVVARARGPRVAVCAPVQAPLAATGRRAAVRAVLAIVVVLLCVGIGIALGYTIARRVVFSDRATPQDAAVVPPPAAPPPQSPPVSLAPGASDGRSSSDTRRAGGAEPGRPSAPSGGDSTRPSARPEVTKTAKLPVVSTPSPRPAPTPPPQSTTPGLAVTPEPWRPAGNNASSIRLGPPPPAAGSSAVSSAPAAAEPAPVTTRAPERPVDNTEAAIRVVLDAYRQAYNARDADRVAAVWPGANTKALAKAFSQLSDQQLNFDSCVIGLAGPKAEASCIGTAMYVPSVGNKSRHLDARRWTFRLEQVRGLWLIASADSR